VLHSQDMVVRQGSEDIQAGGSVRADVELLSEYTDIDGWAQKSAASEERIEGTDSQDHVLFKRRPLEGVVRVCARDGE